MSRSAVRYVPCKDCPFLKEGGIRLTKERAREIAGNATSDAGRSFSCHKEEGPTEKRAHCAGSLILAEKAGVATQMMRIMLRLGLYDPGKIRAKDRERVFDSKRQMIAANNL